MYGITAKVLERGEVTRQQAIVAKFGSHSTTLLLDWLNHLMKFHLESTITPLTQEIWALNSYHITSEAQLSYTVQ